MYLCLAVKMDGKMYLMKNQNDVIQKTTRK